MITHQVTEQKRETEMKCACGGSLLHVKRFIMKPRPQHKNNRIRKKLLKKWKRESLPGLLVGAMTPGSFECSTCGKAAGYYETLGRNLFSVEPLPYGET